MPQLKDGLYLWAIDEAAFADALAGFREEGGAYDLASLRAAAIAKLSVTDENIVMYVDAIGYPIWDAEVRQELVDADDPADYLEDFCALLCADAIRELHYIKNAYGLLGEIARASGTFGDSRRRALGHRFEELVRACSGDELVAGFSRGARVGLGGWMSATEVSVHRKRLSADRPTWPLHDREVQGRQPPYDVGQSPTGDRDLLYAYAQVVEVAHAARAGLRSVLLS